MPHQSNFKSQVFNDFKEKINSISTVNSVEELLQKTHLLDELQELFTTLKVLEKYPTTIQNSELEENQMETDSPEPIDSPEKDIEKTEETLHSVNEEFPEEITENSVEELKEEVVEEEYLEEEEEILEELESLEEHESSEENNMELEQELMDEMENLEEKIAQAEEELAATEPPITQQEKADKKEKEKKLNDNKVRLAHIKGLKPVALFDEETLDELVQVEEKKETTTKPPKQDFKLDLNDKIAFSKILFDGRQSELNETIAILNSFETIEQAQEYLSDVYYKKHWDKVDEYAQRLWSLVENKFQ